MVTTKDIAEICHVSRTTVTRALSGTGRISADTKKYILETAEKLGYQPDLLARSLVKGNSMTIGVVLCDLKNMYFPKVIDAMEKTVRERGYVLNITLHNNNKQTERNIIRQLAGHRIDGIVLDLASDDEANYDYLAEYSFPVIVIGGQKLKNYSYVGNDEFRAAKEAAQQIADKGYRSLYFVFPELNGDRIDSFGGHKQRLRGAQEAAEENGLDFDVIGSDDYVQKALDIMIHAKEKPAFLCSGDLYAGYIMMGLSQEGYIPGDDYGIMGFDNLDIMGMFPKKLTTVENNIESVGQKSMELLLDLMKKKKENQTIYIPYHLIDGETYFPAIQAELI